VASFCRFPACREGQDGQVRRDVCCDLSSFDIHYRPPFCRDNWPMARGPNRRCRWEKSIGAWAMLRASIQLHILAVVVVMDVRAGGAAIYLYGRPQRKPASRSQLRTVGRTKIVHSRCEITRGRNSWHRCATHSCLYCCWKIVTRLDPWPINTTR